MQIHCLNSRLIYPLHGVYMPTQQEYINLFSNYVSLMKEQYEQKKHMADLGCGSGILPIVMKENAGFKGTITCLDSSENALECAKMNLQLYGKLENDGLDLIV